MSAAIAPVDSYSLFLYDGAGNVVAQQFGGTGVDASGNLHEYGYLPYGISLGVYTYGFMLYDARGLRTTSGPGRIAMPGGPLQITVIDN